MGGFQEELQVQVVELQVRFYACCARLQAQTDDEALHDLRIALRRLRSLLRPLRKERLCAALEQAAAALGKASGPLRELEVLAAELERRGLHDAVRPRRERLAEGYAALLQGQALRRLSILLDDWPEDQRQARRSGACRARGKAVPACLARQERALAVALRAPAHDRHRLRLLIKRLRYCAETWPRRAALPLAVLQTLRLAQSALGDWHDHWQWLQCLPLEADLQPCGELWRARLAQAERNADEALAQLLPFFPQAATQS
jgi:CHAD domain-containing protein